MDDDLKRIAARIRGWRDEAGLTLQQLGERSNVSASTIHKIENLQTVPTIAVLLKVAHGLNRRPVSVMRRDERQSLTIFDKGAIEHLVGMIPRNKLDVWRARLSPGSGAGMDGHEPWQFDGEVVILVEQGLLACDIGGERFDLAPGDSIHFDPSVPHRWLASRGQAAQVVVIASIPERLQGDLIERLSAATGQQTFHVEGLAASGDGAATAKSY